MYYLFYSYEIWQNARRNDFNLDTHFTFIILSVFSDISMRWLSYTKIFSYSQESICVIWIIYICIYKTTQGSKLFGSKIIFSCLPSCLFIAWSTDPSTSRSLPLTLWLVNVWIVQGKELFLSCGGRSTQRIYAFCGCWLIVEKLPTDDVPDTWRDAFTGKLFTWVLAVCDICDFVKGTWIWNERCYRK